MFDYLGMRDLRELDPAQLDGIIDYLAGLDLEQLRKRQDLVVQQRKLCRSGTIYPVDEVTLSNLSVREKMLTGAVMRKEFGDE